MRASYFVSDIHLQESTGPDGLALLQFLNGLVPKARNTRVFLVGDIFDLWVGDHDYFRRKFRPIVDVIEQLSKEGSEIHFFEGNHDFHLKRFWQQHLGVKVHTDAEYFEINGRVARVEHGDLINPDDRGYLFLRWFLRTPVMRWLATHLPSKIVQKIGDRASRTSRHYTSTAKELPEVEIRALIHQHARRALAEKPFDLIVSGHVHVRDDAMIDGARSVNLGSWFHDRKVFVIEGDEPGHFVDLV